MSYNFISVFAPGEAFQFDWSEDWALLGGKQTKLQVVHTKLSHSRAITVRAYLLQTHEMLFYALTQAFRVLGGAARDKSSMDVCRAVRQFC